MKKGLRGLKTLHFEGDAFGEKGKESFTCLFWTSTLSTQFIIWIFIFKVKIRLVFNIMLIRERQQKYIYFGPLFLKI